MRYTNIQLALPLEVVERLKQVAKGQGLSVSAYVQAVLAPKLGTPMPNPAGFDIAAPSNMQDLERVPQEGETPDEAAAADRRLGFIKKITG